jgi:hypothetical protein
MRSFIVSPSSVCSSYQVTMFVHIALAKFHQHLSFLMHLVSTRMQLRVMYLTAKMLCLFCSEKYIIQEISLFSKVKAVLYATEPIHISKKKILTLFKIRLWCLSQKNTISVAVFVPSQLIDSCQTNFKIAKYFSHLYFLHGFYYYVDVLKTFGTRKVGAPNN